MKHKRVQFTCQENAKFTVYSQKCRNSLWGKKEKQDNVEVQYHKRFNSKSPKYTYVLQSQ